MLRMGHLLAHPHCSAAQIAKRPSQSPVQAANLPEVSPLRLCDAACRLQCLPAA